MVEPKLLQCFHVFCAPCIKRNTQLDGQINMFKCPQCTSLTEFKELNDVEDLKISPIHSRILQILSFIENQKVCSVSASHCEASWQCLDCDRSLCDECHNCHSELIKHHKVVSLCEMTEEDFKALLKKERDCENHSNQQVEFQCKECDKIICLLCLRGQHQNHKTMSLTEFITEQKDSLSKILQELEKMDANEKEKKLQEQIALDIKHKGEKAQEQVKKLTKKLVKKIIDHEQELLTEIQKSVAKTVRNLRVIRHTTAAKEYIKYFIENGTASEIIDLGSDKDFSKTITCNAFEQDIGGLIFEPNEDLCEQVMNTGIGMIRLFKIADPENSSLNAVEPNNIEATKRAALTVTLRTKKGELCETSLDDVTIHITPENDVKIGEKQFLSKGKIQVGFTPHVPGQLTAEAQVHGNPVSNSPLVMDVKPQHIEEVTLNTKLKTALNTGSQNKSGIAVNKLNTKIAVADTGSHCVRVFNMDGNLLLTYGCQGSGQGQLNYPYGISFLNESDLVICDSNNHRICIVDTTSGKLIRIFGSHGNMNGQFKYPTGVHVDDDSNIIVSDLNNCRIQVFTNNGDYLYQFTIPGQQRPWAVVTHNGVVYVSNSSVVHVIEIKDNHSLPTVTTIGGDDYTDGRLQSAGGLASDNDNNLLVCDSTSKKVYKFTLEGRYVGESNELNYSPTGYTAVLNDGQIICTALREGIQFLR